MSKLKSIPGIWWALILLIVVSAIAMPHSFSVNHISSLLQVSAFLGVIAFGQTLVLITGGLDLSVSHMITFTNIIYCLIMGGSMSNAPKAFAVCLLCAMLVGLFNGIMITKFKVVPMICTLASDQILYGAALVITKAVQTGSVAEGLLFLGTGKIGGFLPVPFVIAAVILAVLVFITKKTIFGKSIYACGSNRTAADVNGIKSDRVIIIVYIISALCAAVSGFLLSSYIYLPSFSIGDGYGMSSIAAAVIGGTLLSGGKGSLINTLGGVLFLNQINSMTNVLNVSTGGQFLIQAIIIIVGIVVTSGSGDLVSGLKRKLGRSKKAANG